MSMRVIPPVDLTSALASSTVPEVAPAAYNSGTTYAINTRVSVAGAAGLVTVYQSLQNGNTNHTPASSPTWWQNVGTTYQSYNSGTTYALDDRVIDPTAHLVYVSLVASNTGNALTDSTKWFNEGTTNARKMFYMKSNASTVSPVPIIITITPGKRIDSILLRGLKASSISIDISVSGSSVYSFSENLIMRDTLSWSDYYFGLFSNKSSVGVFDIPLYSNTVITITITNTNGNAECSYCIIGRSVKLGDMKRQPTVDVLNFSTVERDSAGIATMTAARNVPKIIPEIYQDKIAMNKMVAIRDSLNGTVAAWIGIDDDSDEYFESLVIVGFYRKFSILLRDNVGIVMSLELEEI